VRITLSQSSPFCAAYPTRPTSDLVGAKAVPPVADVYQTTSPAAPAVFRSATVALSISQNVCLRLFNVGAGVSFTTILTATRGPSQPVTVLRKLTYTV